jgi:hypothetical protein
MSQARISSVTGYDVRGRKSGIGILPSRLFVDRGARSLSGDLWRRDMFEIAFFSRVLREEEEVDDDEDVDDMADEADERRLGGLPGVEGEKGIGLSDPRQAPVIGRVDHARAVAIFIIRVSESGSSSQ